MKNFKKFAVALVAIIVVIAIGLATKTYWGRFAWGMIQWVCDSIGIDPPNGIKDWLDQEDVTGHKGVTAT